MQQIYDIARLFHERADEYEAEGFYSSGKGNFANVKFVDLAAILS